MQRAIIYMISLDLVQIEKFVHGLYISYKMLRVWPISTWKGELFNRCYAD